MRSWQTRSRPQAWWHAWTSWIRLRLPLRSGASARVDPIGILRITALPIIAQSFVAVLFRKAEAQRILCYEMTQACYDFETFSTCGPKRKAVYQHASKLYAYFCSHSLQKRLGPRFFVASPLERPPVDTSKSTDARASLGGAAERQTRHICSQFTYSTHVVCLECEVSGSALCEQCCRKTHCAMCSMLHAHVHDTCEVCHVAGCA